MLPGLRFLMLATVLSCALLVFGLGAAAFLRATHDRFATTPPWQAPREVVFAGQPRDAEATLSLLRIDTPPDATDDEAGAAHAPVAAPSPQATPAPAAQPPASDEQAIAALFPPAPAPVERDATADVLAALASAPSPSAAPDAPTPAAVAPEPEPEPLATETIEPKAGGAATPAPDHESPASQQIAAVAPPPMQDAENTADAAPASAEPSAAETTAALDEEFAAEPIAHPPLPRPRPAMTRAARQTLASAKRARELQSAQRRQAAMRTRAPQQQQPQQQPAYLFPSLFGN